MALRTKIVICPKPDAWAELHRRLQEAASRENPRIPPPPVPLILAGWTYSNDVEKQNRWQETLAWTDHHGLGALLNDIEDGSMHVVSKLSDDKTGPLGGPMKLDWKFDPKPDVDAVVKERTVEALKTNWNKVVGGELGAITSPIRLTGAKGRRLVVWVKADVAPPWGTWTTLADDEKRRSFTAFRAAVNAALAPLEVDHIDFVFDRQPADC
jgi:hypothetical protein